MNNFNFDATAARIKPYIRYTPILDIRDTGLGDVILKLDSLQPTGSFKVRGAANSMVSRKIAGAGVVAVSGGNHGAAVAYVGQKMGIGVTVFVPDYAPQTKIDRIKSYGAAIELFPTLPDAFAAAQHRVDVDGAHFVHPYNTRTTIEGQGTCAHEFIKQADFDTLLVGVGGGGLAAGCALAIGAPQKLVCVETDGTNSLSLALAAGHPVSITPSGIAADALGAQQTGDVCFDILRDKKVTSVVVTDDHVRTAQRFLWDHTRLIIEGGGATAMAALTSGVYRPAPGERVGVIICGANTNPSTIVQP